MNFEVITVIKGLKVYCGDSAVTQFIFNKISDKTTLNHQSRWSSERSTVIRRSWDRIPALRLDYIGTYLIATIMIKNPKYKFISLNPITAMPLRRT